MVAAKYIYRPAKLAYIYTLVAGRGQVEHKTRTFLIADVLSCVTVLFLKSRLFDCLLHKIRVMYYNA